MTSPSAERSHGNPEWAKFSHVAVLFISVRLRGRRGHFEMAGIRDTINPIESAKPVYRNRFGKDSRTGGHLSSCPHSVHDRSEDEAECRKNVAPHLDQGVWKALRLFCAYSPMKSAASGNSPPAEIPGTNRSRAGMTGAQMPATATLGRSPVRTVATVMAMMIAAKVRVRHNPITDRTHNSPDKGRARNASAKTAKG